MSVNVPTTFDSHQGPVTENLCFEACYLEPYNEIVPRLFLDPVIL